MLASRRTFDLREVFLPLRLVEDFLQLRRDVRVESLDVILAHDALAHETRAPRLTRRRMVLHQLVHPRLREARLIGLVVTVATETDDIDEEILAEALAIRDRETHCLDARLGVVAIHVNDRYLEPLGEVARVECRARVARIRREPDLIVRDDVQRAANSISAEQ